MLKELVNSIQKTKLNDIQRLPFRKFKVKVAEYHFIWFYWTAPSFSSTTFPSS